MPACLGTNPYIRQGCRQFEKNPKYLTQSHPGHPEQGEPAEKGGGASLLPVLFEEHFRISNQIPFEFMYRWPVQMALHTWERLLQESFPERPGITWHASDEDKQLFEALAVPVLSLITAYQGKMQPPCLAGSPKVVSQVCSSSMMPVFCCGKAVNIAHCHSRFKSFLHMIVKVWWLCR